MGEKILVAIERTTTRYVEVDADSPNAAKAEIVAYGETEAWSDYRTIEETETVRAYLPRKLPRKLRNNR